MEKRKTDVVFLSGRRTPPLFVSVLLHGNEDTGWLAARSVLKKFAAAELPRALSLFIGNVEAAGSGPRRLDGQPEYNRVLPGSEEAHPGEGHGCGIFPTGRHERRSPRDLTAW